MAFAPSGQIWFYSLPLDVNYKNQIYFKSRSEQNSYFSGGIHNRSVAEYLVVRKTMPDGSMRSSVKVGYNIDDLYSCNYMRYTNPNHGDRYFYAFITQLIYVNENTTEVVFETDVWQTWGLDVDILDSFVIREHSETDAIGDNVVPEKFVADDYDYTELQSTTIPDLTKWGYLIGVSEYANADESDTRGRMHSGIYQGLYFYYFDSSANEINSFITTMEETGGDCIQFIALIPRFNVSSASVSDSGLISGTNSPAQSTFTLRCDFGEQPMFDFTPKNKKLFTSPFVNLVVTNHNGDEAVYNIEEFSLSSSGAISFKAYGDISANPSISLIPVFYKGANENYDFGISIGGFPQCAFNSDTYKLWLAKNQFNQISSSLVSTAGIGLGIATAAINPLIGVGAIVSGASGLLSVIGQDISASREPNKIHGGNAKTNLLTAAGKNKFDFFIRKIRSSYAKTIDDYFTMFGYQTNRIKKPNISSRPYFNYVQTADVNIWGGIPEDDLNRIKQMFNEGVTFWKPNARVGNYAVDNSPT